MTSSGATLCLQLKAGIQETEAAEQLMIHQLEKKVTEAHQELTAVQKQHKSHCTKSLHNRLKEAKEKAEESKDKAAAKKAAAAIEAIICTEHMQESYDRIQIATQENPFSGGLDRLDVPT